MCVREYVVVTCTYIILHIGTQVCSLWLNGLNAGIVRRHEHGSAAERTVFVSHVSVEADS